METQVNGGDPSGAAQGKTKCNGTTEDNGNMADRRGEWVRLNVGGTHFLTTRSTLCKDPQSLLCKLLQGTSPLLADGKDESGALLIDRDPSYFAPILNFMRHGKLIVDPNLSPEGVLEEAEFYNVTEAIRLARALVARGRRDGRPGKRHMYRALQCHEHELTQLISTMSQEWNFEQVINIGSQYKYGSDEQAEFICIVSQEYGTSHHTPPPPPPLPPSSGR